MTAPSTFTAEVIASISHPGETRQFSLSEAEQVLPVLKKNLGCIRRT